MGKPIVYLCGAINGCSDAEANDWRQVAIAALSGFDCLDPMRRDYRGREGECVAEIVAGDLADIRASQVVLVAADRPSWGTAMECFYAFSIGRRVVTVCASPSPSPWLVAHSTRLVSTLADAIANIESERTD